MNTDKFKHFLADQPEKLGLFQNLNQLWHTLRNYLNQDHKRTLPFGDYVIDRWEKAKALGFGEGSSIYDSALVLGDVKVGEHTWIGPGTIIDGTGGLEIGSYCSISAGVHLYTHDTVNWSRSGGKEPIDYASTSIGNYCYLGPNVVVAKGVTIGDGAVIGANSLVLKDIPAHSKAFGTPCRVVGDLETVVPTTLQESKT